MANPTNQQQQRVDHVAAAVKSGAVPVEGQPRFKPATPAHAAEDLKQVSHLLEILGDALASDPKIVKNHGIPLQNLDIAIQTLIALAATMQADNPEFVASVARLAELRIACRAAILAKS
jgi:hypothetical protein